MRLASRETLRLALLRGTPPFCAARMSSGSAALIAATALFLSPDAIASSTFRTKPRIRERRARLMMVRRAIFRAAFFAELVLAICRSVFRCWHEATVACRTFSSRSGGNQFRAGGRVLIERQADEVNARLFAACHLFRLALGGDPIL